MRFENALYNIARSWRHTDRRLKYMGFTVLLKLSIAAVSQVRSPLSQSELVEAIVSDASMVHVIDRLVKTGLDIREPLSDRRVIVS